MDSGLGFDFCINLLDCFMNRAPVWVAVLDNGVHIIQDDWRTDLNPPKAWQRLKLYIEKTGLKIVNFHCRFMDNINNGFLADNAEGYFYRPALIAMFGAGSSWNAFSMGYVKNGVIYSQKIKVPEMIKQEDDVRPVEEALESIIWNVPR